jgi:Holliday junction resolvase RusA-like endonuclease
MSRCDFFVPGKPATAGSKRAFPHRTTGRIIVGGRLPRAARSGARPSSTTLGRRAGFPQPGAIALSVVFIMPRPLSHRRKDGTTLPSAPRHHITKPDTTKMLRAIEDALTGIAWIDDAQVIVQTAAKRYARLGEEPGAKVTIEPYTEEP